MRLLLFRSATEAAKRKRRKKRRCTASQVRCGRKCVAGNCCADEDCPAGSWTEDPLDIAPARTALTRRTVILQQWLAFFEEIPLVVMPSSCCMCFSSARM